MERWQPLKVGVGWAPAFWRESAWMCDSRKPAVTPEECRREISSWSAEDEERHKAQARPVRPERR